MAVAPPPPPAATIAPATEARDAVLPTVRAAPSASAIWRAPAPSAGSAAPGVADDAPVEAPRSGPPVTVEGARTSSPEDTESEAHLLARAEDALTSNPAGALALAELHATRFAHGVLGQEREVVAIRALLQLGRASEAKARAQRFASAHPGSAHRPRIEALVGP
jgi:hypothetical protein